ncbi:hypothetical protein GIB67_029030 [Kingdonia uniflora]|uniref:Uncharacterized protein n=1 Tax=Kingdonia uniflora TaxID=39325 RepID=A0A7J7N6D2_9MAGN|nr:hypothetical protein GIB67_029030 [Kingdonia uniflora]
MGHLWFQTANDTVPLEYHTIVADLDEAAQYDWGSAILASLYHGFDNVVTTGGAITIFSQLLEDFSLPGEPEGPDLGWHMEWTGGHEMFPIHRLRDPPPISSTCGAEELWYLTHGMRRLFLTESAQDPQRMQKLTDEVATLRSHLDSVDDQLYAHDLHQRKGRDVRVVPLPPRGSARTKQRGSGPQTRGGGTSRRG